MFRKTSPNRICQDLVEQIQEAIADGKLKAGDKLPSQRELGEIFQTSRATLREALRVLEDQGLIEIKLGVSGGARIRAANTDRVSDSIEMLMRNRSVSLNDLMDFRMVMEGFIAERACELASEEDIKNLNRLKEKAYEFLTSEPKDWKPYAEIDAEFHQSLAQIAGNPLFQATLKPMYEGIHNYFYQYLPDTAALIIKNNYDDICQIIKAIEDKKPADAKNAAIHHVTEFNHLMEKNK
jgi:DNA-binding FadR family transcriptional regulator